MPKEPAMCAVWPVETARVGRPRFAEPAANRHVGLLRDRQQHERRHWYSGAPV